MAGTSNDQKLAASMIPAANPNIASRIFLSNFFKPNTKAAPNAVNDHVKIVAIRACKTGLASVKKEINTITSVK